MSFKSSGYKDIEKYRAASRRRRQSESGKLAKKRYRNGDKGRLTHQREVYRWIKKNPEKARAHMMVLRAIKRGLMSRKPCVICGEDITHAHHIDYSKPYDVTWLCHAHHMNEHQLESEGN
jgi:hypothetical protein